MSRNERLLDIDDLVDAAVGVEGGLNLVKDDDGAVCAASPELAVGLHGGREADGVVEGEAERLVCLLAALAAVKKVLLEIVYDGEERAAGGVGRRVFAVRTCDAASYRT